MQKNRSTSLAISEEDGVRVKLYNYKEEVAFNKGV